MISASLRHWPSRPGCSGGFHAVPGRRLRAARVCAASAGAAELARQQDRQQGGEGATAGAAVLRWACRGWGPAGGGVLRVGVRELGPGRGRGLVALEDLAPGEALLSVPFTHVFGSEPASELHWSADMALRLLRAKHAEPWGHQAADTPAAAVDWRPWIAALPASVRTPLEFSEDEVGLLGCPYMMDEVSAMQECIANCYEVLQPELEALGCGWDHFLYAVQVFHSRCFYEPASGRHLCVPGVDMANHSASPSAEVRIVHSPAACQGHDATAEIAEPPPPEPSRFSIVAGDAGVRCGEEVTISYGRWPSEAFLLLFGFVPADGGTSDALTLFRDAEDMAQWAAQVVGPGGAAAAVEQRVASLLDAVHAPNPGQNDSLSNLVVTHEGVDQRLQPLLAVMSTLLAAQHPELQVPGPKELLRLRIQERAADFAAASTADDDVIRAFGQAKRRLALQALERIV